MKTTELHEKKNKLESDILNAVKAFEDETGLHVSRVSTTTGAYVRVAGNFTDHVRVEVVL